MEFEPNSSPWFLVGRVAHLFRLKMAAQIKERGVKLSPEEISVLLVVAGSRKPQRIGALAEVLLRDATTVKRQLDSLLKQELVQRATDPTDRRGVIVSVSESGRELVSSIAVDLDSLRQAALDGVSKEDVEVLIAALAKMLGNLST